MDNDSLNYPYYSKISRNEISENVKFDIIKKFGFSSFMTSTSIQSKKKSFNEKKSDKAETTKNNILINKSFIDKNKSAKKQIILHIQTVEKNQHVKKIKKKDNNNYSFTKKIDFKEDKNKNKAFKLTKSYTIEKYSFKKYNYNNNSYNKSIDIKNNKKKSRIKSILVNQSLINNVKIKKYENFNENNKNKKKINSNKISITKDEINMNEKRELLNKKIFFFDNNSNNKEDEIEQYYNIDDNYSLENISEKYNIQNYNVKEPCKNFESFEDNVCELNNEISERKSNDNDLDKNSILSNNNTLIKLFNKRKQREIFDDLKKQSLFTKLPILLKNTDSCNISSGDDSNNFYEINNQKKPYEKVYNFIYDIQKDVDKLPSLNVKSFLKLKDYSLYRLMGFIFDSSSLFIRSNFLIKSKIKNVFYNIFSNTINNFSNLYSSFLKVINYYFENRKIIINKKIMFTFNLVIICKVITKEVNKSYEISYNYISNNKDYDNLWKIDIKRKNDIKTWLHTELFNANNYIYNFTSTSQISSFSYGDEVKFEINIFNHKQQLNPYSIKWLPPVISDNDNNIIEANQFINKTIFDPLRFNEIEIQTLKWEEISIININNDLLRQFINIFNKKFKIKNIYTYTSKHIFYKFRIIPNKKGVFAKNKFLFFDINIIDYDKPLQNEVQSIYLMNSNFYNKKMDVRIGTIIIFYITEYQI